MRERCDHPNAIFHALERAPPDRDQFLDAPRGGEVVLHREKDILLAADDELQGF